MINPRYAYAVCVLLAFALVPTVIHSYAGVVVDDGRTTTAVGETLAGFTSTRSDRDAAWGQRRFESADWFERRYVSGEEEVLLTVLRSYDLKRLYHHPELDVAYGAGYLRHDVVNLSGARGVPVHVLRTGDDGGGSAMYVLYYDAGFVEDPLWFQVGVAAELLFGGRKPMTLIFARDVRGQRGGQFETYPSARILVAAIDQFVSAAPQSK